MIYRFIVATVVGLVCSGQLLAGECKSPAPSIGMEFPDGSIFAGGESFVANPALEARIAKISGVDATTATTRADALRGAFAKFKANPQVTIADLNTEIGNSGRVFRLLFWCADDIAKNAKPPRDVGYLIREEQIGKLWAKDAKR